MKTSDKNRNRSVFYRKRPPTIEDFPSHINGDKWIDFCNYKIYTLKCRNDNKRWDEHKKRKR